MKVVIFHSYVKLLEDKSSSANNLHSDFFLETSLHAIPWTLVNKKSVAHPQPHHLAHPQEASASAPPVAPPAPAPAPVPEPAPEVPEAPAAPEPVAADAPAPATAFLAPAAVGMAELGMFF